MAFSGGYSAWGAGHIDVKSDPKVPQKTNRSGITIHSGKMPGSAGYIDWVNHARNLIHWKI